MFKHTALAALTATLFAAGSAQAENVEIYLVDMHDNIQQGYCLDIGGAKGYDADPAKGLQGHTCYSPLGALGVDQEFDDAQFGDGTLFMPRFDVCATVSDTTAGTTVDLAACDGSDNQKFTFSGEGMITPAAAPEMCFTLAEDTRFGRSKQNQIKNLSLQPCSPELASYQTWSTRVSVD